MELNLEILNNKLRSYFSIVIDSTINFENFKLHLKLSLEAIL